MRFLFTAAGTAGHINPALSIAGKMRELFPEAEFLFIGADREMEKRLIPAEGYELKNLTMTGFARGFSREIDRYNRATVHNLAKARREAQKIVDSFRPDVVIGTGGYVCYPVIMAAARRRIPTVLHESNAIPGLAVKVLSGVADRVLVAYPNIENRFQRPGRVVYTGTPVRSSFENITRSEARERLGVPEGMPVVVSFWGSLGADGMNAKMADFIRLNADEGAFYHIHATGGGDAGLSTMRERLREKGVASLPLICDLRKYIDNMGTVMTAADLVISRSGASTIAELTNIGRASILVPSPNVTNNHQEKNALEVEKAGGAVMIRDADATGEKLFREAKAIVSDPERERAMEKGALTLGTPDCLTRIADVVLGLVK